MAEVGHILEIETVDGQLEARVEFGNGQQITATVAQGGGCDVYPLAGDRVLFHRTGGSEIVVSAIYSEDAGAASGEWRVFSRNASGAVMAVVHAKNDGSIDITNASGKTVNVGGANDFVAMAQKVDSSFSAILNSITNAATGTADGGAAFKTNLVAALQTALNTIGSVASANLKAE